MKPMPLHKGMIIVLGLLGDNFYADEILPRLLKLQNVNKGDSCLFHYVKGCPFMHLYNIDFLHMNCFFVHSFIRTIFLEIFLHSNNCVRHHCRGWKYRDK